MATRSSLARSRSTSSVTTRSGSSSSSSSNTGGGIAGSKKPQVVTSRSMSTGAASMGHGPLKVPKLAPISATLQKVVIHVSDDEEEETPGMAEASGSRSLGSPGRGLLAAAGLRDRLPARVCSSSDSVSHCFQTRRRQALF